MNSASCSRRMRRSEGSESVSTGASESSSTAADSRFWRRQDWMHFWWAMPKSQLPNLASSRRLGQLGGCVGLGDGDVHLFGAIGAHAVGEGGVGAAADVLFHALPVTGV